MAKKKTGHWEKEWQHGEAKRYYRHSPNNMSLQLGKFRPADSFDRAMGHKYKWHGKYYVNTWYPEETKLFKTKSAAEGYAARRYGVNVRSRSRKMR